MRRRDFLHLGTAAGFGVVSGCGSDEPESAWSWRGVVFESPASFILHGVDDAAAKELTVECVAEMKRLEAIFSLRDPESTLSILNRDGVLREVPDEFRSVVTLALALGERSGGVFDPTIQPYWKFLHEGGAGDKEEVMKLVDFRNVMVTNERIAFAREGMAMTLNGMAQGFVSDRIAEMLKAAGVEDALVNIGEYVAIGRFSKRRPWTLGIRSGGANGEVVEEMPLEDAALAVSSGGGYQFEGGNHLVHPEGTFAKEGRVVAVTAPLAVVADGLATACGLLATAEARTLVSTLDDASLKIWEQGAEGAWTEVV